MKDHYFALSVYDYGRTKLCDLYDGNVDVAGQAQNIKLTYEIGGWKEMSFTLPTKVEGEKNFRLDYMCPEYLLRVVDGDHVDWYVINEPSASHSRTGAQMTVTARHLSTLLKTKNLYLVFDDENGIDTIQALMRKILRGTDWTLGVCDTFYEADGTTEKVRSLKSDGKEGAYQLINEVCELFRAYPTFHGEGKTVDIHALQGKDGMMELNFGGNLTQITRKKNSDNVVTRLYVEGEYLDDGGYVGIEGVNPTGLQYILNFDHFKDLGVFTKAHQDQVDAYTAQAGQIAGALVDKAGAMQKKASQLNTLWGQAGYVVYAIEGVVRDTAWGGGAEESDAAFEAGDELTVVTQIDGAVSTEKKVCAVDGEPGWPAGAVYAVKYVTPAAGSIGGKEVAIEAKEETIVNYEKLLSDASTSENMKAKYRESIATLQKEIAALRQGGSESAGLDQMTLDACVLAMEIWALNGEIEDLSAQQLDMEAEFVIAMGDMLRDGYWSNTNYVLGQEQALYEDALEVSREMSRPEISYTIGLLDLSQTSGHECDEFRVNQQVRIYDSQMGLNDYAYITKLVRNIGEAHKNTIEVTTSE